MNNEERTPLTRRVFARLTIMGAVGLSFLPGRAGKLVAQATRSGVPGPIPDSPLATTMGKWAELGRVWRELCSHSRDGGRDREGFEALKPSIAGALDAVQASPELREAFDDHYSHIQRGKYSMAMCYSAAMPSTKRDVRRSIERQVRELERLVADEKLTREAGEAAAAVIARDVETRLRAKEIWSRSPGHYDREIHKESVELHEFYRSGDVEPREAVREASRILADLTVDDIGSLSQAGKTPLPPPDE